MSFAFNFIARSSLATALWLSAGMLCAQPAAQKPDRDHPHKPPPQALEACKALQSGHDCSFTSPRGTVKGSCFAPQGKPLACRPKDAPAGAAPPAPPPLPRQ